MTTAIKVRCNRCHWEGTDDQLKSIAVLNPMCSDDVVYEPGCPACLSDQWLEYEEDSEEKTD